MTTRRTWRSRILGSRRPVGWYDPDAPMPDDDAFVGRVLARTAVGDVTLDSQLHVDRDRETALFLYEEIRTRIDQGAMGTMTGWLTFAIVDGFFVLGVTEAQVPHGVGPAGGVIVCGQTRLPDLAGD